MSRFDPPLCPHSSCPSRTHSRPFLWRRKGFYARRCDARSVPRFHCLSCRRSFSTQTFRLDFRLRKPWLAVAVAKALCAKASLRKTAEDLEVTRRSVERRLDLFGPHCQAFHLWMLERHRRRGRCLDGAMTLDELETFEGDRLLAPVTVALLTEKRSLFLVDLQTGPLPARGRLSARDQQRKAERERATGRRRNGSREAVRGCLQTWRRFGPAPGAYVELHTDQKPSYRKLYREAFAGYLRGMARVSSREKRDRRNALFVANHTNAMARDGVSRLVRESWAHSKLRARLEKHLWVWAAFRNYVRGITRRNWRISAAMALGVARWKIGWSELLRWRAPFFHLAATH
ncbi:MAG: IS1 family transposase [Planctomycetota bacterium]|nr:MAG: IS1 family transposase [Planctomycetota bacterium]